MLQHHSIILWKKAEKMDKSFEEISKEAYLVMDLFQDMPCELRPNYLTAYSKNGVKEFDWNFENFANALRDGVNREEEEACGFLVSAGNKSEKFNNALIIDLPLSFHLYDKANADLIIRLFGKLVQLYSPYWGCVSNKVLARKYGKFLEGSKPTTVHWVNYWSEEVVRAVGRNRIRRLIRSHPDVSFEDGILLVKDTAFDLSKEEDIRLHEKMHKQIFP